jgi:hypothetical protein
MLFIEELNDLYMSHSIVRTVKSRTLRCARHVAGRGKSRIVYRILVRKPRKDALGRPRM